MSTNDRPSKRARITEEVSHAHGGDVDALALTLRTTLGIDVADGEVPHLLIKTLTFLAVSTELVRSRAVSRVFRRWSDSAAEATTAKLIGASVKPMLGQSVTGLLHGAEQASEETREHLRGWDAEAVRAEGFDVGMPTHKSKSRADVLALIPVGDLAPEVRVPVGLHFGDLVVEHGGDDQFRATRAKVPAGFFHLNIYPKGTLDLCNRQQALREERALNDTLRRVQRDLLNPDWDCPHCVAAARCYLFTSEGRKLYDEYLVRCFRIFSDYKLGQPRPPQFKEFCEEVAEKSKQIEDERQARRAAEQEG